MSERTRSGALASLEHIDGPRGTRLFTIPQGYRERLERFVEAAAAR